MKTPRIEVDLTKIYHNAKLLVNRFRARNVHITGVTKVVLGHPEIARVLLKAGVQQIGDSRIENIMKMRQAGLTGRMVMIRTPMLSQVEEVVRYADISMNTELEVIQQLSAASTRQNLRHKIVLMAELGDLREGIPLEEIDTLVQAVLGLPGIDLIGLGTNLVCFGGVMPTTEKMNQLSALASRLEAQYNLKVPLVSGGNSANYQWLMSSQSSERINDLRIGELIYLGKDTLNYEPVPGLHQHAFTLVAEVIEVKNKNSLPTGEINRNAFGDVPHFQDKGRMRRAILGLGRQDVRISDLEQIHGLEILGSSSDHTIVDVTGSPCCVGEEMRFHLTYGGIMDAMTSPYVMTQCINRNGVDNPI